MSKDKKDQKNVIDVVIETPRGCRNKYAYDEEAKAFRLKKIMPVGAVFPYDFGFIPHTKGGDGDPLDILVIMDEAAYPGCIVGCKIVGILKAVQSEKDGPERNDRLIGVSVVSHANENVHNITDINENILDEIQHFFISYNQQAGKEFKPQGWSGADEAMQVVEKAKK